MAEELKSCPFCGSDETSHGYIQAGAVLGNCECHTCNAGIWADTEAEAIAAWNARPELTFETDALIEHMVTRFLAWRLPNNFTPDGGISFRPWINLGTEHQTRREPRGTNLLDYTQAKAMVRFMLEGAA